MQKGLAIQDSNKLLLGALGVNYARAGKRIEARKIIKKLERQPDSKPTIASIYSVLGERKNALAALRCISEEQLMAQPPLWIYKRLGERERFYESVGWALVQRPPWLFFINVAPGWEPFRSDLQFQVLIRRMGL